MGLRGVSLPRAGPRENRRRLEFGARALVGRVAALRLHAEACNLFAVPLNSLLQRFERAVELFERCIGPALPSAVDRVEIGPFAVHRSARSLAGPGASRRHSYCRDGIWPHRGASGVMPFPRKTVKNSLQARHGGPTCAPFPERGKQGVNRVYDLANFVKNLGFPGFWADSGRIGRIKLPHPDTTSGRLHSKTPRTIC